MRTIVSLIIASGASCDAGVSGVERAVFRHRVSIDAELFCNGIGAQSGTQLLGDLLLQCRGERRTADAFALSPSSGYASTGALSNFLRFHFGQTRHDRQ